MPVEGMGISSCRSMQGLNCCLALGDLAWLDLLARTGNIKQMKPKHNKSDKEETHEQKQSQVCLHKKNT